MMTKPNFVHITFFLSLFNQLKMESISSKEWQKVYVNESYIFLAWYSTLVLNLTVSRFSAAVVASKDPQYSLICRKSDGMFIISALQVSPAYNNGTTGLTCYTNLKEDLAFGAGFFIKPDFITLANRPVQNLVDGIYTRNDDSCAQVESIDPWVILDLHAVKPVKTILITQYDGDWKEALYTPATIKYSVGPLNVADVSNFNMFATYTATPSFHDVTTFQVATSVQARYIMFEKKSGKNWEWLVLCHVQIFST